MVGRDDDECFAADNLEPLLGRRVLNPFLCFHVVLGLGVVNRHVRVREVNELGTAVRQDGVSLRQCVPCVLDARDVSLVVFFIGHDRVRMNAAHVADLVVVWLVRMAAEILGVERSVHEAEVGEEALGRYLHGLLEQIVIRVAGIVVRAFLHLEYLYGEDGRLAVAQALFRGLQDFMDDELALGRGIGAVVNRTERYLGAGTGVMDECAVREHEVLVVHDGDVVDVLVPAVEVLAVDDFGHDEVVVPVAEGVAYSAHLVGRDGAGVDHVSIYYQVRGILGQDFRELAVHELDNFVVRGASHLVSGLADERDHFPVLVHAAGGVDGFHLYLACGRVHGVDLKPCMVVGDVVDQPVQLEDVHGRDLVHAVFVAVLHPYFLTGQQAVHGVQVVNYGLHGLVGLVDGVGVGALGNGLIVLDEEQAPGIQCLVNLVVESARPRVVVLLAYGGNGDVLFVDDFLEFLVPLAHGPDVSVLQDFGRVL